ncbi:MAG: hypothetical protein JW807_10960 [Spirochaetes bacterium]|nr:hypothetical protein [Spirochaetota bacterium]
MKAYIPLLLLCVLPNIHAPAAEMKQITAIREYYAETLKKIKDGSIHKRELSLAYPIIPGAGPNSSLVRIFYDMITGRDGQYEYGIVRIENNYQHGNRAFYEEYLFNPEGDLLFYYGRRGTGTILRPGGINWTEDERYYFWGRRLVSVMREGEMNERPSPAETKKGAFIQQHAEELRIKSCTVYFPAPILFVAE